MTKVIGYVRVSTEEQAKHGFSIDAQTAKLEAYASLYDLDLIAIEVDAGVSAKSMDRPGVQRALARLQSGEATGLLIAKLDRLTRSVTDLGRLIESYFKEGKYALLSVAENIDARSAAGRLVLNVLGSVVQWEREATGERTRDVLAHKKSVGENYCRPPFGYRWACGHESHSDDMERTPECGEMVADPAQGYALDIAKQLRAGGMGYRKIAERMNASRQKTPRGGRWHATSVRRILIQEAA